MLAVAPAGYVTLEAAQAPCALPRLVGRTPAGGPCYVTGDGRVAAIRLLLGLALLAAAAFAVSILSFIDPITGTPAPVVYDRREAAQRGLLPTRL